MIHGMNLTDSAWCAIVYGEKDIEMRLCDEKRARLRVGDVIEFTNRDSGKVFSARVVALHRFADFSGLYAAFAKERLGYLPSEEAHPCDMEMYYSREDIEKYGALGIELSKPITLNND